MNKKFDVFISYNSNDRDVVERFITSLVDMDLNPFLDIWNLTPGKPWQEELESAIQRSKHVAIFIGASGIGRWQNEEMRVALEYRLTSNNINVIPVLLPGATLKDVPSFLLRFTYVDFREGLDNPKQYSRLVKSLGILDEKYIDNNMLLGEKEDILKIITSIAKSESKYFNPVKVTILAFGWPLFLVFLLLVLTFTENIKTLDYLSIKYETTAYFLIYCLFFLPVIIYTIKEALKYLKYVSEKKDVLKSINNIRSRENKNKINSKYLILRMTYCKKCENITPSMVLTNKILYFLNLGFFKFIFNILLVVFVIVAGAAYYADPSKVYGAYILIPIYIFIYMLLKSLSFFMRAKYRCLICDSVNNNKS